MKNNFITYKLLPILSIIILVVFVFMTDSVYAASSFNTSYDYMYNYEIDNDFIYTATNHTTSVSELQTYIDSNLKDDRVISGDYYYFIYQNFYDQLSNVLVKKDSIEEIVFSLNMIQNGQNTISYNIDLSNSFSSSNVVALKGRVEYTSKGLHHTTFYCDSDNHVLTTNFATNYDR